MASVLPYINKKVDENNQQMACFTEVAKTEMSCYMMGAVFDPIVVAGAIFKRASLAKLALNSEKISSELKISKILSVPSQAPMPEEKFGIHDWEYNFNNPLEKFDSYPNPTSTEVSLRSFAMTAKNRQLAMGEEEFNKMKVISSDANIPVDQLPSKLFEVYRDARLKSLPVKDSEYILKILNNIAKKGRVPDRLGSYDYELKRITIYLGEETIEDLKYHWILSQN